MFRARSFKAVSIALALSLASVSTASLASQGSWSLPDDSSGDGTGGSSGTDANQQQSSGDGAGGSSGTDANRQQGQSLMKQAEGFGSNAATFGLCLLMVPLVGPEEVLTDDACQDSVKNTCRLSSTGVPKPAKCAVFPVWSF